MAHHTRRTALAHLAAAACIAAIVAVPSISASLDPTFGSGAIPGVVHVSQPSEQLIGRAVGALPDGSIIAATNGRVFKYTTSGALDTSFGPPSSPGSVTLQAVDPVSVSIDGNSMIVIAGSRLDTGIGPGDPEVVRMSPAGVIDSSFSGAIESRYRVSAPFELGAKIAVTTFDPSGHTACMHRLVATNGTLDPSFGAANDGHACVTGSGEVTGAYGGHNLDGTYTLYVAVQTVGPGDVAGTQIEIADFNASGVQQGGLRTTAAVPGEYLLSGQVAADGSLLVSGQRHQFADGFVRRYVGGALDLNFAPGSGTPGTASLSGLRIERLIRLPDSRIVAVGAVGAVDGQAQARLLTADGRPDGALQPDGETADRLSLPHGAYIGFTPNNGHFSDAVLSAGRLVFIGTETHVSGLDTPPGATVLAHSGLVGASTPVNLSTIGSYIAVVPERLLDTRPDTQVGYAGTKPAAGASVPLQVTGAGTTRVPTDAKAVVLNVTGTEATADGFITVWPCGGDRPLASNLNMVTGGTRPNLVVVGLGTGGTVCLFTQSGTHVIADVDGYFTSSSQYTPAVPGRLLDTRPDTQVGYIGAKPAAGAVIHLQVTGNGLHLAPIGTAAVVLNLTGTEVEQGSYVNVYACGTTQPFTSSLNLTAGSTASNLVIAPVAPDGTVCLFTLNPAHLIADISGWFPPGSSYTPVTPDRLLDTREAHGFGNWTGLPAVAGETVEVGVIGGRSGVPTDASAVIVDVVGVDAKVPGYITVWPCGAPRPLASNLNLRPGDAAANSVLVGIGVGGKICLYTQNGAHLIVDIFGYNAPR